MTSKIFKAARTAVITGAASCIGFAAARYCLSQKMNVVLADLRGEALARAHASLSDEAGDQATASVLAVDCDVSKADEVEALKTTALNAFGDIALVMNNAVTRDGGGIFEPIDGWHRSMEVNYWGVVHGVRTFAPLMMEQEAPSAMVNCGSKQGITNPPGNSSYNITKAAVKFLTESLQHELRGAERCPLSAHLLIPGWTTSGGREHKPGAWLPDQVVAEMVKGVDAGDFYILCPDNEVSLEMDGKRIRWAAGDITENRPPLSRWHEGYKVAFELFER